MAQREMFPDCRNPKAVRLVLDLQELADGADTSSLLVTVRSGRGEILASGVTLWRGEEHVDLPRALEAAHQAFINCDEPEAPPRVIEEHLRSARATADRNYRMG